MDNAFTSLRFITMIIPLDRVMPTKLDLNFHILWSMDFVANIYYVNPDYILRHIFIF